MVRGAEDSIQPSRKPGAGYDAWLANQKKAGVTVVLGDTKPSNVKATSDKIKSESIANGWQVT